ncbi:hypothetical protein L4D00_15415 [Photobacterium swingsii]|uniref:hypothetical protein n=1 Tax=Photobacterium swingsii TaxID=680026 RepID=UPI003D0F72E6
MGLYQTILVAAAPGFCSAFGTGIGIGIGIGIAMKTDIAWIKKMLESHDNRLQTLEKTNKA